ncbi:MAG: VCBS repeat-containing protein [Planctomycetes bacterium]|nr:VCBS repeat-containing protein [Planctomycetota bacterium]
MSMFARTAVVAVLAGLLPGQAGFSHDVGWLPEPRGALVQTEFVDMNGDTFLDIVRLRQNAVEVLLQDAATGRYERTAELPLGLTTAPVLRAFAVGRLDASRDGFPDLAVVWSNGDIDLLRGDGSGGLSRVLPRPWPTLPAASGVDIFAGDLDGNLLDDLIVLLEGVPPQYLAAQAGGGFIDVTATQMPAIGYQRPHATMADVDGDLDLDLVLCSTNSLPPRLFRNQNGTFFDVPAAFGIAGLSTGAVLAVDLANSALPEIIFARPGNAATAPVVKLNVAGTFATAGVAQQLLLSGVLDMAAADIDNDGAQDVVFVESDGRLGFALRGTGGVLIGRQIPNTSNSEPLTLLGPFEGRRCLGVGDVEGDGDDDIVSGGTCPDSLLLHDRSTGYFDVERLGFPASRRSGACVGAIVDRDGNDDPDFVGLYPNGEWIVHDNDGSGDFSPVTTAAVVPNLSPATSWTALLPMTLSVPGRRDLIAFGNGAGIGPQIAVLAQAGGSWVDDTATRFAGAATGTIAAVATCSRGGARDSLVLGTFAGELELHENVGGVLVHRPGAFPSGLQLWTLSSLLCGDFTGDGLVDVLALSTGGVAPKLFVANATGFVAMPGAVPATAVGDHGLVADLDGDDDLDVLLRRDGQAGLSALRWSGGAFSSVNLGSVSAVNFVVRDMAVVQVGAAPRIVLAREDGLDATMSWNGAGYSNPVTMPYRGTPASTGLLTADIDRDRDVDVLVLRDGMDPAVLKNTTVHLQRLGPSQAGRMGHILLRGQPGSFAFIAYGLPQNTQTPWGLLRLNPATMGSLFLGAAPASGENVWQLSLAPTWPRIRFPLQAAWFEPSGQIVLSALEHLVVVE